MSRSKSPNPKSQSFMFRLSDEEKHILETASRIQGVSVANLIRIYCVTPCRQVIQVKMMEDFINSSSSTMNFAQQLMSDASSTLDVVNNGLREVQK